MGKLGSAEAGTFCGDFLFVKNARSLHKMKMKFDFMTNWWQNCCKHSVLNGKT
jgi:hypothetical protein